MLDGGCMVMGSATGEATPVFTSLTGGTQTAGFCSGNEVGAAARVRVAWTVTNPTSSYKVYQDEVLQSTQAASPWDLQLAGLVEGNSSNPVTYTWVFRVDAILASGAVGASSSVTVTKSYGDCSGGGPFL